jgi:hypothetical protein
MPLISQERENSFVDKKRKSSAKQTPVNHEQSKKIQWQILCNEWDWSERLSFVVGGVSADWQTTTLFHERNIDLTKKRMKGGRNWSTWVTPSLRENEERTWQLWGTTTTKYLRPWASYLYSSLWMRWVDTQRKEVFISIWHFKEETQLKTCEKRKTCRQKCRQVLRNTSEQKSSSSADSVECLNLRISKSESSAVKLSQKSQSRICIGNAFIFTSSAFMSPVSFPLLEYLSVTEKNMKAIQILDAWKMHQEDIFLLCFEKESLAFLLWRFSFIVHSHDTLKVHAVHFCLPLEFHIQLVCNSVFAKDWTGLELLFNKRYCYACQDVTC